MRLDAGLAAARRGHDGGAELVFADATDLRGLVDLPVGGAVDELHAVDIGRAGAADGVACKTADRAAGKAAEDAGRGRVVVVVADGGAGDRAEDGARGAGTVGVFAVVHGHLSGIDGDDFNRVHSLSLVHLAGAVDVGTIVVAVGGAAAEGDGQAEKADHEEFLLGHGFVLVLGRKNGHFGLIFRSVHILTIHHCGCGGRMRAAVRNKTLRILAQAGCSGCRKAAGRCGICGFAVRRGP